MRQLTAHFENWLTLIQQVGDDIENEMGFAISPEEYSRRMDLRLNDLEQPLNVFEYEEWYGSRYRDEG